MNEVPDRTVAWRVVPPLSGVMLTAKVALDRNPRATDAQLKQALASVLCRCGAHTRMMKAIRKYQQEGVRA